MTDEARRDRLAKGIVIELGHCSVDELRVLDVVLTRMRLGRDQYGPLDLSKPRDWEKERAEELVDERFYAACAELQRRDEIAALADHADSGDVCNLCEAFGAGEDPAR